MMTLMDRSVLYQINSLEKPQKISGFLKEKGYSRQNLVDLRKDEQAICLNGTYVHMTHMLADRQRLFHMAAAARSLAS